MPEAKAGEAEAASPRREPEGPEQSRRPTEPEAERPADEPKAEEPGASPVRECTTPTGEVGGSPTGPPTVVGNDLALVRENEAATRLAEGGFRVEQNPTVHANPDYVGTRVSQRGNPDYLIEGRVFDCYSPTTADARSIVTTIAKKVNKGQAARVVLNLTDSAVEVSTLSRAIQNEADLELQYLQEVIAVTRSGEVVPIFSR
jgi:hypothetical protein